MYSILLYTDYIYIINISIHESNEIRILKPLVLRTQLLTIIDKH